MNIKNYLINKKSILRNKDFIFSIVCIIAIIILTIIPTGFEKQVYNNAEGVKARVISVDNSNVHEIGLIKQREQKCSIKILNGSFKNQVIEGVNLLSGKLEVDKIFKEGDKAFVLIEKDSDRNILFANMIDHYRIDLEIVLVGLFIVALIMFSGITGIRTIISFAFTNRFKKEYKSLSNYQNKNITNGHGKLCMALKIDKNLNSKSILGNELYISDFYYDKDEKVYNKYEFEIEKSKRINIDYAQEAKDYLWRFFIKDNNYVSANKAKK